MGTIKRTFANNLTGAGKIISTGLDSVVPASNIANSSVTNVTEVSPSIGAAIKGVAGNPPSPSQALGDMWYDTDLGALKNFGVQAAAWSSGGNMPTGKTFMSNAGTQTAQLSAGGGTSTRKLHRSREQERSTRRSAPRPQRTACRVRW